VRLFSTDPDDPGVFAVGQLAYGVFALGQMATGVVAIGQLARGVIAIGQGAIGIVAIGQGAVGVAYGIGMIGLVGRGLGIVVPVLPKVRIVRSKPPKVSPIVELGDLEAAGPDGAWVRMSLDDEQLSCGGKALDLETAMVAAPLSHAVANGHRHAMVKLTVRIEVIGPAEGYRDAPETRDVYKALSLHSWSDKTEVKLEGPLTSILGLLARTVGFCGLAALWWFLAGRDVAALFGWAEPLMTYD